MERRICHNDGVSPVLDGRLFFKECMSLSDKCYSFPIARNVERPTREGMPIIGVSLRDGKSNDFAHRGHREQHLNRTQVHHISDHMVATKAITSVDEAPSMIVQCVFDEAVSEATPTQPRPKQKLEAYRESTRASQPPSHFPAIRRQSFKYIFTEQQANNMIPMVGTSLLPIPPVQNHKET